MTDKLYSETLEDYYVIDPKTKKYLFKGNVNYTPEEMKQLKGVDKKTMQGIHMIKKRFGGTVSKEFTRPDQLIKIESKDLTQYVER